MSALIVYKSSDLGSLVRKKKTTKDSAQDFMSYRAHNWIRFQLLIVCIFLFYTNLQTGMGWRSENWF